MIQLEFQQIRNLFGTAMAVIRRMPKKRSKIDYTLRLSSALRVCGLTHQVHDVLCAVAKHQVERGFATIPGVQAELSCTYQNVVQHFLKNPHWFLCDESHKPRRFTLSPEAIQVLAKVQRRISMT